MEGLIGVPSPEVKDLCISRISNIQYTGFNPTNPESLGSEFKVPPSPKGITVKAEIEEDLCKVIGNFNKKSLA